MKNKSFSIQARCTSLRHALSGIRLLLREPNAWIHALATASVLLAGYIREIPPSQWVAIAAAITLVWVAEAFNTCTEKLCDYACRNNWHPAIKTIKDISAGAVFIAVLFSIAVAFIVFIV